MADGPNGGFGIVRCALPWLRAAVRRVDPASLRVRLAVSTALIVVLPFAAVIALNADREERAVIERELRTQELLAASSADAVLSYLALHRAGVLALAQMPVLTFSVEEQTALLGGLARTYPDVSAFASFDPSGRGIARGDGTTSSSPLDAHVLEATRKSDQVAIQIQQSSPGRFPIIALAASVRDAAGEPRGVVVAEIEPNELIDVLRRVGSAVGGRAYLVDDRGHVIVHEDFTLARQRADMAASAPVAAMLSEGLAVGSLRYAASSDDRLAGFARVPEVGWGLVVERSSTDALASGWAGREWSLSMLVVVAAAAAASGWAIAGWLVAPLAALARGVALLADGGEPASLPRSGITEIRRLARAFGEMRDRLVARTAERERAEQALRSLNAELDQRVSDRTQALATAVADLEDEIEERMRVEAERERLLRETEEAESRFRLILESNPDPILIGGADGRVRLVNQQVESCFGYRRDELIGMPVEILMPERFRAAHVGRRNGYVAAPRSRPMGSGLDLYGRRKDGSEFPIEVALSFTESSGERLVIAVVRDITERRAVERMKEEFVSMVSHEIRTPMNGVVGMAELLLRTDLADRQREYVEAMWRSGEALRGLVDDILDFSKIEAGRLQVRPAEVSPRALIEDVATIMGYQAAEKGLDLLTVVDEDVPSLVTVDPNRLRQVLVNLIGNAIKFTERGAVSVRVKTAARRSLLRVDVVDTGIGIEPDLREWLFQAFVQADSSTTRGYGGTGLGLAISRRLVEFMGGQIGVDSEPGQGSTFWFTVQLLGVDGSSRSERLGSSERPRTPPAGGSAQGSDQDVSPDVLAKVGRNDDSGSSILVVEDSPINQRVARGMLETLGYRCHVVEGGAEALDALSQASFALILMDCQMPGLDGYQTTAEIRHREETTAHTPIVAMTADAMVGARERCLAAGMDDYIAKPVRLRDIADVIERWLPADGTPSPIHIESSVVGSPESAAAIDEGAVEALRQLQQPGRPDFVQQLATVFLDQAASAISSVRSAVETGDLTGARRLVHTLKGDASTWGAEDLRRRAAAIEQCLDQGRDDEARQAIPDLQDALERVCVALERIRGEPCASQRS